MHATEEEGIAMNTDHAIEVNGLRKVYPGGIEAVAGIDFAVAGGEVFSLLGPNGAGKSTTIGMLTATVAPTSGTARLGGFDVTMAAARGPSHQQRPVPRSGDRPAPHRSSEPGDPREPLGVPADASARRIGDIVEAFDLIDLIERPVGSYSGGERRRLEIARALVSEPRVLFLDEPTVGLDPRIRHELLDVIGTLRERSGMTILLTTHYLDEAERLSDRIAIMRGGRIVALGTPQQLTSSLGASWSSCARPGTRRRPSRRSVPAGSRTVMPSPWAPRSSCRPRIERNRSWPRSRSSTSRPSRS